MKKSLLGVVVLGLVTLAALVVFAAPAEQAAQPEKDPEKVLAKVETQEIKEKDVDQVILMAGPQGAVYDNEQGRKAILDELVAARLFAISGAKQGLDQTPEFKSVVENFANQALARVAIEKALGTIAASEEESKKFYDENPAQFTTPEELRARHILLSDDVTSADKVKTIQDDLKKGVSFDVLAVTYSTDPSAAQGGGDLGFFGKGQMVPEFEEAAFALKEPGDVSDPVRTSYGWHIIKLEEKKPSTVVSYDEVKPQIIQYLSNEKRAQKYRDELEVLKKEYKVELFEASADVK
ncbi:MAG: peptidylprolyl isomerase [Synergistaceae bacterium]|nr:peptidylprolyl isomerase [Synergistaceae bacterium]